MAIWNTTASTAINAMLSYESLTSAPVALGALCLAATILVLVFFSSRRPRPGYLQRLESLQYIYAASAVVKASQATHLDFPSPQRHESETMPTILKDFGVATPKAKFGYGS